MSSSSAPPEGPVDRRNALKPVVDYGKIRQILAKHRLLWIAPTILFGVLGTFYALTKSDTWQASQALLVRDEAVGEMGFGALGRFDSSDSLKRSLETILQIAKNKQVVVEALRQLDSTEARFADGPSEQDVERIQDDISV